MPVIVAVTCGVVAMALGLLLSRLLGRRRDDDPVGEPDRFLVDWLSTHERGRRVVTALDHRLWGGAMLGLGVVVVTAFGAVTGLLLVNVRTGTGFARLDEAAARWGAEHGTDGSTQVLSWMTDFGSTTVMVVAATVVGVIELLRRRTPAPLAFVLVVVIGVSLVNGLLKRIVDRDRPELYALVDISDSASFPSGHSAVAAAGWTALALVASRTWRYGRRRWAVSFGVGVAVLVATTRVLISVHWTTDVLAGLAVGWTWCFLVTIAFGTRLRTLGDPARHVGRVRPKSVAGRDTDPTEDRRSWN